MPMKQVLDLTTDPCVSGLLISHTDPSRDAPTWPASTRHCFGVEQYYTDTYISTLYTLNPITLGSMFQPWM